MQKLAYFSQVVGVPIPCSFEIYNFGPYSDSVTFAVESMIADDVLEDRSRSQKYSNYHIKSGAPKFSKELEERVSPHKAKIENVVQVLGKFDPPQLELLATLHFIASKIRSLEGAVVKDAVLNEFFRVKGGKFPREDVSSWYEALKTAQLV